MAALFKRFQKDGSGATAIEYALIAGLVAVAIIAGLSTLGTNLNTTINNVAAQIPAVK